VAKNGKRIGVDLGTVNTLLYVEGYGVVFNEPSMVAYDIHSKQVIAAGHDAADMVGKTHDSIRLVNPLEDGALADLDAAANLLTHVLGQLQMETIDFKNSTILICYPSAVSMIEQKALNSLASRMGVADVLMEKEIKAGAIGAGINISAPEGAMVIDIGGGTTDVGILSLGDLVVCESIPIAGNLLDHEIAKYVKQKHQLLIGPKTAERVKIGLGSLLVLQEGKNGRELSVGGRDVKTGLPKRITLNQREITPLILTSFEQVVHTIKNVLAAAPPELASDIFRRGVMVNGGGALIEGMKEFFEKELKLKVAIAENALTSIVEGSRVLLKTRGSYLAAANSEFESAHHG